MTTFSEAQLIEITARFNALEKHIERADLILVEREESFRWRAELAEERWARSQGSPNAQRLEKLRSIMAVAKLDAAHIHDVRGELEKKLEACRQDLDALLEQARRA